MVVNMAISGSGITKFYRYVKKLVPMLGWVNTGFLVLSRLLASVSSNNIRIFKYQLVAQPVNNKPFLSPTRGRKIVIRQIDMRDPAISYFPRPLSVIQQRFKDGAICLSAFKDGAFVGFIWLMLGPYQEDEVRADYIPLPAKRAVWDFDVYVHPDYRLGFTFLRLWDEANQLLSKNGFEWSCSRISSFSARSSKSHAHLGTIILGQAVFIKLVNWQVTFASIKPYIHISLSPDSFPKFHLETTSLNNPYSKKDSDVVTD
ncbi:hypothetical protein Nstercoris_02258 [Nitrosomonas stercoris]|uniref:N-acetyltransferase domain-containing protein n=1 Tax=Nitrosomonas stercoris TaxID=1444684 RepID=A0A4Y1YQE5_9PROT|nr:hypothetical protein Nstercoris_02258 [Nitrosomonas stercoris]